MSLAGERGEGGGGRGEGVKYILQELSKKRYTNHTCSFRNERYRNVTELPKHMESVQDRKINYKVKWRNVKQATSYSNINHKCTESVFAGNVFHHLYTRNINT